MAQVATMFNTPPPSMMHPPSNISNMNHSQSFQTLQFKPFKPPDGDYDGKRLRKSVMRKTVDYNSSVIQMLEGRIWQRDERDRSALPPDISYASHILPPPAYLTNPINAVVTKFVRSSTNKAKCPIFCLAWTPEGRRLVTGASSGEFTLWNGLTFNFETILQAHESSVRAMVWSHNDQWMVTGDTSGYVKYWQSNMNNVKMFQAHKDPVRGLSFSPSDLKLASGSDDGTVRIWDFYRCAEERVLIGHGSDVKCVDWHPSKSLLASGSKDNQQPIKLWDPRCGTSLAQLHAHKSTVMDLKWNSNGMWLCSASRDHLLKLFDIRNFSTELQIFRGHKKEAASIAWHPQHEGLFASGGSDGSILFWHVGNDKEVGAIESAHDGIIWDMAWHPLGHILCSGSNDHSSKFWTRNRPGDKMRDKYNLNTLPPGVVGDDCVDIDDIPLEAGHAPAATIPGMGPDDKVASETEPKGPETIPGLEFDSIGFDKFIKKTPYAKPIPKTFQAAWNAAGGIEETTDQDPNNTNWVIVQTENLFCKPANIEGPPVITEYGEKLPPGSVPIEQIKADAIAYFGFYIPLKKVPGNKIQDAFSFYDEEEALVELTSDQEFARKLVREKKGLYNPSLDDSKNESDHKKDNTQRFQDKNRSHSQHQNQFQNRNNNPQQQYQQQQFQQHNFHPNDQRNHMRDEGWANPKFQRNRNFPPPNFQRENFNPHQNSPSTPNNFQRQMPPDFQKGPPPQQQNYPPPMGEGGRGGFNRREEGDNQRSFYREENDDAGTREFHHSERDNMVRNYNRDEGMERDDYYDRANYKQNREFDRESSDSGHYWNDRNNEDYSRDSGEFNRDWGDRQERGRGGSNDYRMNRGRDPGEHYEGGSNWGGEFDDRSSRGDWRGARRPRGGRGRSRGGRGRARGDNSIRQRDNY